MRTKKSIVSLCLLYICTLFSCLGFATSSFVNNQLLVPYVTAGSQIHDLTLNLVLGSQPPVFELGPYST